MNFQVSELHYTKNTDHFYDTRAQERGSFKILKLKNIYVNEFVFI